MKDINKMTQSELLELQQQLTKLLAADAAPDQDLQERDERDERGRRITKPLNIFDMQELEAQKQKDKEDSLENHGIIIDNDGRFKIKSLNDDFVYVYSRKKDFAVFKRMTTVDMLVLDKMLDMMTYAGDDFGGQTVQLHAWQLEQMADDLDINVRKIRETIKKLREGNIITSVYIHDKHGKVKEIKAVVQVNPFVYAKGSVKDIINLRTMYVNRAVDLYNDIAFYEKGE